MVNVNQKERQFIKTVWQHYQEQGRHNLPWRQKSHLKPYNILVSEVMLQQTQVERVLPKYRAFLRQWGSVQSLSSAPLAQVLTAWQGLGYNRRAKNLQLAAKAVAEGGGRFPSSYEGLCELSGVGPYTAGAVMAFAYNQPVPIIETNIRTVYLHHFFNDQTDVDDREMLTLVKKTLDLENPREWYWALMDYGAFLKQTIGNNITQSRQYKKQSTFKGSDRQIRGAIIKLLTREKRTRPQLHKLPFDELRIDAQVEKLLKEGMIKKEGRWYQLP